MPEEWEQQDDQKQPKSVADQFDEPHLAEVNSTVSQEPGSEVHNK